MHGGILETRATLMTDHAYLLHHDLSQLIDRFHLCKNYGSMPSKHLSQPDPAMHDASSTQSKSEE